MTYWALTAMVLVAVATLESVAHANETGDFFGPSSTWNDVAIVGHQGNPLSGATEIYISGDGSIRVINVALDPEVTAVQQDFQFGGQASRVTQLIQKLIQGDVLGVVLAPADPPHPDFSPAFLFVRNAAGEIGSVLFLRSDITQEYEAAWLEVSAIANLTKGATPASAGPYDKHFVPPEFDWVTPLLLPRKDIRFAPSLSEEAADRLEEAFLRAIEALKRRDSAVDDDDDDDDD